MSGFLVKVALWSCLLTMGLGEEETDSESFYYNRFVGPVSGEPQEISVPRKSNSYYKDSEERVNDMTFDFVAKPDYSFIYGVEDPKSGISHKHEESREGDVVKGEYSLVEPDGSIRRVVYTADSKNGFRAVVHRTPPQGSAAPTEPPNLPVSVTTPEPLDYDSPSPTPHLDSATPSTYSDPAPTYPDPTPTPYSDPAPTYPDPTPATNVEPTPYVDPTPSTYSEPAPTSVPQYDEPIQDYYNEPQSVLDDTSVQEPNYPVYDQPNQPYTPVNLENNLYAGGSQPYTPSNQLYPGGNQIYTPGNQLYTQGTQLYPPVNNHNQFYNPGNNQFYTPNLNQPFTSGYNQPFSQPIFPSSANQLPENYSPDYNVHPSHFNPNQYYYDDEF